MRNLITLMHTFAIVTVASIAPAPASAETMGAEIDIGMVYDATDAVSVNADGFMVTYEYRCNFKESATVSDLTIHKEAYPATVDVGVTGYVNHSNTTAPLFIEEDDCVNASQYDLNLPDATDTYLSRRARDGLRQSATV